MMANYLQILSTAHKCNGCMPVKAVCKPQQLMLEAQPLASLVERPPPAPASRVRDLLGVMVRTRGGYNTTLNIFLTDMFMVLSFKMLFQT